MRPQPAAWSRAPSAAQQWQLADRDAGRGAAIGVLGGGLRQRMQQNKAAAGEQQQQQQAAQQRAGQQQQQQQAAMAQGRGTYERGFAACMEGRGYAVK